MFGLEVGLGNDRHVDVVALQVGAELVDRVRLGQRSGVEQKQRRCRATMYNVASEARPVTSINSTDCCMRSVGQVCRTGTLTDCVEQLSVLWYAHPVAWKNSAPKIFNLNLNFAFSSTGSLL